jgi:hypothetical protein
VILFFRFLCWTAKYEPSHAMLFVLAGALSAALLLASLTLGAYVDRNRSSSQH